MTVHSKRLPPATLRSLQALDAIENKRLLLTDFRRATGVKARAFHPFLARLERERFIRIDYGFNGGHTYIDLTFGGMQALKAHEAEQVQ